MILAGICYKPGIMYANTADSLCLHSIRELQEVTISINRDLSKKINEPQHVISIAKSYIDYANKNNTADLLAETGQITIQKSQQGGGSPILRGFEASRILLVVDGIRMNNLIYRTGHLQNSITVDQFALNNIEVLFGPSSLNFGSDALGGTILFNTLTPIYSQDDKRPYHKGNITVRHGSANQEGTSHIDFNYGNEKLASVSSFTFSNFSDLRAGTNRNPFLPNNDSYIRNEQYTLKQGSANDIAITNNKPELQKQSGYYQYDVLQKIAYKPTNSQQHTINFQLSNTGNINRYDRLNVSETKNGIPQPKFAEWYYGPQFRLLSAYHYDGNKQLCADKIRFTVAYQKIKESRHDRRFKDVSLYNTWENVNIISFNSDWIKYLKQHKLHAGIDGNISFLNSTANVENIVTGKKLPSTTRYPDGKNSMHTIELFAMHNWERNARLNIHSGTRIGYATTYSSILDKETFPFYDGHEQRKNNFIYTLSFGINYKPSNTIKLAWCASSAYRVPNIDNTSKVFDSKLNTVTIPNKNIKPEKTVSVDFNITKHNGDILIWENVIYGTYYFDAITTQKAKFMGQTEIMYKDVLCEVYTQTNAKMALLWGFSTNLIVKPSKLTEISASCNYTYGRIIRNNPQPLDHIPPVYGRVGAACICENRKGRLEIYTLYNGRKDITDYNMSGEDNIDYATVLGKNGKGIPAWFTLNIKGSYNIKKYLTIQFGIENILDTEYRLFASGINAAGRNIYGVTRIYF